MRSQLYRQQFSVTVGNTPTRLLSSSPKRWAIVLGGIASYAKDASQQSIGVVNVSTAAAGTIASFTVPAGQNAVLLSATCFLDAGTAPTVALQIVRGANTINVAGGTAPQQFIGNVQLLAGDVVRWQCTTGGAGSTVDATLSLSVGPVTGRVTFSFQGAAVLDQGITMHPGDDELVLIYDHIGSAITEDISAIASINGVQVSGIEVLEVDCGCSPMTNIDPRLQQ